MTHRLKEVYGVYTIAPEGTQEEGTIDRFMAEIRSFVGWRIDGVHVLRTYLRTCEVSTARTGTQLQREREPFRVLPLWCCKSFRPGLA